MKTRAGGGRGKTPAVPSRISYQGKTGVKLDRTPLLVMQGAWIVRCGARIRVAGAGGMGWTDKRVPEFATQENQWEQDWCCANSDRIAEC